MSPNVIRHRRARSAKQVPCVIRSRRLRLAQQARRETPKRAIGWPAAACLAVSGALSLGAVAEDAVTIIHNGVSTVYANLNAAITALENGDKIVFHAGTYTYSASLDPVTKNASFQGAALSTTKLWDGVLPDGTRLTLYDPQTVLTKTTNLLLLSTPTDNITAVDGIKFDAANYGAGVGDQEGGALMGLSKTNITPTISNSVFINHNSYGNGGAILTLGGAKIDHSWFENNEAFRGGAFYAGSSTENLVVTNSVFKNNIANRGEGGAMWAGSFKGVLRNSVFVGNTAGISGGGFYVNYFVDGTIENSIFSGNTAQGVLYQGNEIRGGGAITFWFPSSGTIDKVVFSKNTSATADADVGTGGGAINMAGFTGKITNSTFAGNTAYEGGAIRIMGDADVDLSGSRFFANSAGSLGGGLMSVAANNRFAAVTGDVVFQGNTAAGVPNAMYFSAAATTVALNAASGRTFWFYDPIKADNGSGLTINEAASHTGTVLFDQYESVLAGPVTVAHGTLVLQNGASLDLNGNTLTVAPGATFTVAYEQARTVYTPIYGDENGVTTGGAADIFLLRVDSSTSTPTFNPAAPSHIEGDATFDAARLRFLLPSAKLNSSTPLLTVSGTASLADTLVDMVIPTGAATYSKGDRIVLIDAAGGTSGTPATHDDYVDIRGRQGATLQYDFKIADDTSIHELVAYLDSDARVTDPSHLLPQAGLGAVALTMAGLDMAAGEGMAAMASQIRLGHGKRAFGLVSAADSRYKTGSYVDVEGAMAMAGLSNDWMFKSGDLIAGAFVTYGNGNVRANSDAGTARGDTSFTGAGLMARFEFKGTKRGYPYLEGSLQGGSSHMNFHSSDLKDYQNNEARFKLSTPYFAAHLGGGYIWRLADAGKFETYLTYLAVRRNSDKVTLSTGDPIEFAAVTSQRLRLGARRTWLIGKRWQPFVGLAVEEEFSGKAKATTHGQDIDAPEIKGTNGVAEVGLKVVATEDEALTLNMALHGYAGKRRGMAGMFRGEYRF